MKTFFLIIGFVILGVSTPKLSQIRADYSTGMDNANTVAVLYKTLATVTQKDNKTLVAYKGAVLTAMAKHTKGRKEKKAFFTEGAELLEYAVSQDPNNIEIRTIRLSIQENAPKFLKYHASIDEDKEFILKNYKTTANTEVKEFVRSYVLQSKGFSDAEKDTL